MRISNFIYMVAAFCMLATGCSDYTPNGYTEEPSLPAVSTMAYTIGGAANHEVNLSWTLPADKDVTGCLLYRDAREIESFDLTPDRTYNYTALGTALGQEVVYTVKVKYSDDRLSTGHSVIVNLPEETFAGVDNLNSTLNGRTVTLTWTLPSQAHRTGVRVITNGDTDKAVVLGPDVTTYTLKSQPMETTLTYSVEVMYDNYYFSPSQSVQETIPYIEPKMLYLLPSNTGTSSDLADDDERAAAAWFASLSNAEFIHPSEIADYDPTTYSVMWIEIDRVGLELGWEHLPADIVSESTIQALKEYSANGGSLYLANMATQLTVPLGFVPEDMAPTVYGNGDGGQGDDVWVINPYLGWDFREGADQGFYDRTNHAIFQGLTLEDPNNYGYETLPLIGPGQREDHNCMWDCNIYGRGDQRDVIKNFEVTTNSLVLATWGHVRDHCVAGLVEFYANPDHGRCIANGLAAYEWNQNSGVNIYQHNVEKLTENILEYLK